MRCRRVGKERGGVEERRENVQEQETRGEEVGKRAGRREGRRGSEGEQEVSRRRGGGEHEEHLLPHGCVREPRRAGTRIFPPGSPENIQVTGDR